MALIVVLQNKSNLADISDYDAKVLIGDGTAARSACIYEAEVKGHRRNDGWQALVMQLIEESLLPGESK